MREESKGKRKEGDRGEMEVRKEGMTKRKMIERRRKEGREERKVGNKEEEEKQ